MARIYGIDLGATYSTIAKLGITGDPEIIADTEYGSDSVASAVFYYGDGTYCVGGLAKEEGLENPERLHQFFKRWIGRSTDPKRKQYFVDGREIDPVELSSIVLRYIINYANLNGEDVKNAVITCPAYFDSEQRKGIVQAANLAGLNVIAVINEPTAAAIYYYNGRYDLDQKVLVFDLGGATLDVTAIEVTQDCAGMNIQVLAADGNPNLGGYNWDGVIYRLLLSEYEEKYGGVADDELKSIIYSESEGMKRKLTRKEKARVKIPYEGELITLEVSREKFEHAAANLVDEAIFGIDALLNTTEMTDEDVDVVLAVGCATQMPMIRKSLIDRFGEKVVFWNPKSVVEGSALVADMLQKGMEVTDSLVRPFEKRSEWTTAQIFDKLQIQIQQGISHFVYIPLTDRIEISYEDDNEEKELVGIFREIRRRKTMLLSARRQIEELWSDPAKLLCDRKSIIRLRAKLRKMEESRKRIEELVNYRLWENMTGLFMHANTMEKLNQQLNYYLADQERIEEIISVLSLGTDKITSRRLEEKYLSDIESKLGTIPILGDTEKRQ